MWCSLRGFEKNLPTENSISVLSSQLSKMSVHEAWITMAVMLAVTCREVNTLIVQVTFDIKGDQTELLNTIFKHMELVVNKDEEKSKVISPQEDSVLVSTLLQVAPSVTISGNITDQEKGATLSFTLHTSHAYHGSAAAMVVRDEDEEEEWQCCASSGVLSPIVDVVEPYFLGFVELVFNGILSSVITNFLEGSNLIGDVRLV